MHQRQHRCPDSNQGAYHVNGYSVQRNSGSRVQVQAALWLSRRQEDAGFLGFFFKRTGLRSRQAHVSDRKPQAVVASNVCPRLSDSWGLRY